VLEEALEQAIVLVYEPCASIRLWVDSDPHGSLIDFSSADFPADGKRICIWNFKVIEQARMVAWFAPVQLIRTAVDVIISEVLGQRSDFRLVEALTPPAEPPYADFTREDKLNDAPGPDAPNAEEREEIWIDYVADVGDGWNSTYAVASCLASEQLEVENKFDTQTPKITLPRASVLCFGGDQVYPVANRQEYRLRLIHPYETALPHSDSPHPQAFAIPGNHDWYDSLVSFTRLFCSGRWFAGWRTSQARSYFALKLPGGWWLLGTDVQLGSDIDRPQVEYFKNVAEKMRKGDHVIICTAEPHWVLAEMYGKDDPSFDENNLAFLEKKVLGEDVHVAVFIAGDQHHYRRYAAKDGTQKITAGGGGAFLHPTHGAKLDKLKSGGFKLKACFPSTADSRRLVFWNLLFPFTNPTFGLLTGFIYLLTAWTVAENVSGQSLGLALFVTWKSVITNPLSVFWILLLFFGLVFFSDSHPRWFRWVAGPAHGLAHLAVLFLLGWGAAQLFLSVGPPLRQQHTMNILAVAVFVFAGAWVLGSILMGVYLLISLNVFGAHWEAASSLGIADHKNFLRMRIGKDGSLTIYPIGVRTAPRKWRRVAEPGPGPDFIPEDPYKLEPELIEPEIRLQRSSDPAGGVIVLNERAG
jgi:hypothetical protein